LCAEQPALFGIENAFAAMVAGRRQGGPRFHYRQVVVPQLRCQAGAHFIVLQHGRRWAPGVDWVE